MKLKVWTIAMIKGVSGEVEPVFYYNHVRDSWVREFQNGCAFFSEEECNAKNEELNILGTEIINGVVE